MQLLSDQITSKELAVVLQYAEQAMMLPGDMVEFGCYIGTTSVYLQPIALKYRRTLHVYDSFEGLPEKSVQDESPAGIEFKKGELSASKKQFVRNFAKATLPLPVIHKAWFSQLTQKDIPASIAFAFLDGDYYYSISDSLNLTWPHLQTKGFVLVHDYATATLPGVKKCVDEFINNTPTAKLLRQQEHVAIIQKL
jgi:O-methyltransferase